MFATVEKYSGPAKIILGLIAITFVGFTAHSVTAPGADYIVKVGERKVSEHDVNNIMQDAQGQSRDAVFRELVERAYLMQGAKDMGISVSQEQVKQIIVDNPDFHDAGGKFSQEAFNRYLSQRHMSEDQFVEEIREQFALQNLLNLVRNGTLVSDAQAEQLVALTQSERVIRSATFSPETFADKVKIDEKDLRAYYEEHKKDYVVSQAVKLQFVALNSKALAEKEKIEDAELRKAFDQYAATAKPMREIAHILFQVAKDASEEERQKSKAEAEKVLAEVKSNPSNFAALAKKHSQDVNSAPNGGNLGMLPKDGGLGKEFEDSAFSLKKGEISGVVQTEYGYHIITILNTQDEPDFEKEKSRLEAELKQKKAAASFAQAREKLADAAFNHPESLEEVAKQTGLKVESPDEWLTKAQAESSGMPAELVNAIFSDDVLKKKHNSEPVNANDDTVWVVRAKEVREEKSESFDAVKEHVRMAYWRAEASKLAQTQAKQSLESLQSGKTVQVQWSPVSNMTAEQARTSLPPEAYNQLLKAKPGKDKPAYVLLEGLPAPVLVEVQSVKAPENVKEALPPSKQALTNNQVNRVFVGLLAYLRGNIKQKQGAQKLAEGDNAAN